MKEKLQTETILVVDDHELFAYGVISSLKRLHQHWVVEWAPSLEAAVDCMSGKQFDLVLLDLRLGGVSGVTAFRALRGAYCDVPIAILSAFIEPAQVRQFVNEGARGVMEKDLPAEVLGRAVELMCSGAIYVPPSLLDRKPTTTARAPPRLEPGKISDTAKETLTRYGLRDSEIAVAASMCRGLSNKEIARELGLQEGTVKVYVSSILRALGVKNRVRAVLLLHA